MGNGAQAPPGFLGNLSSQQEAGLMEMQSVLSEVHFPESGLEEEHLRIWGVDLYGIGGREMSTTQKVVLLKFLRSRDFDVDRAAAKLMKTLQWRKSFDVANITKESFPKELEGLCYNYGKDRCGRPVQYNIYANLDPAVLLADEESTRMFIRYRVKFMEETIAEQLDFDNGIEDIVHVHDYSGVALMRMDINFKSAMQRIIRVFGAYYPEMLSVKYFVNIPRVAELLFNVVRIFVNPRTVSKFHLSCQNGVRGALLERIAPDKLPPTYGGFLSSVDGWCAEQCINIPARSKVDLRFQLDSNEELRWEFLTENLDVGVRVRGHESDESVDCGRREYGVGKFKNLCKGLVALTLDNSYSLFTDKTVWIRTGAFGC